MSCTLGFLYVAVHATIWVSSHNEGHLGNSDDLKMLFNVWSYVMINLYASYQFYAEDSGIRVILAFLGIGLSYAAPRPTQILCIG